MPGDGRKNAFDTIHCLESSTFRHISFFNTIRLKILINGFDGLAILDAEIIIVSCQYLACKLALKN